jgi:predicted AAA+ superfamily ATPase
MHRPLSPPQGGRRCPPHAQRAVPACRVAEVHPNEERLRITGGQGRHRGTGDAVVCRDSRRAADYRTRNRNRTRRLPRVVRQSGHRFSGVLQFLPCNLPERDVRALANVGSLRDFERFLRACALRSANLLNKADLARDVGIAPSTANQWLSMLEASGQAVLLEPWFSNRTKSIVKSFKLYVADAGLLCALLNIRSEEALRQSPAAGAVWETFVFAQLRDRERRAGRAGSLFFWRDRTREVDFVVDAGGRLELFEAKWTELPDLGDTVNLDFVRNVVGKSRVTAGGVVSRTANSFPFANGFRALPVTELG